MENSYYRLLTSLWKGINSLCPRIWCQGYMIWWFSDPLIFSDLGMYATEIHIFRSGTYCHVSKPHISDLFPHMSLSIMTLMRLMSLLSLKKRRSPSLVPQSSWTLVCNCCLPSIKTCNSIYCFIYLHCFQTFWGCHDFIPPLPQISSVLERYVIVIFTSKLPLLC